MDTSLALQPCRLTPEILGKPLPFDLYSGNGTLLLKLGASLNGRTEGLLGQSLFRAMLEDERDEEGALRRLEDLLDRYGEITGGWSCSSDDVWEVKRLADELAKLCASHSDVCVCLAGYLSGSHALRHSFAVAIVATILGSTLGWDSQRISVLSRAALTMNLSLLAHHDEWAKIHGSLSKLQKIDVKRHSCLSADLLSQSPGTDVAWISTVEQHHENFNGSGYPLGLKGNGILPEARVLRAADIWCALVLHPSGRGKKHPRQAIRELSDSDQRHIDPHVFNGLKKLMGAYPPGTLIRLLNRETALVVRWERKGIIPQSVLSIISPLGDTLNQFRIRSADQYGFGIRDYTHLNIAQLDRLPWRRILKAS